MKTSSPIWTAASGVPALTDSVSVPSPFGAMVTVRPDRLMPREARRTGSVPAVEREAVGVGQDRVLGDAELGRAVHRRGVGPLKMVSAAPGWMVYSSSSGFSTGYRRPVASSR
jgi:hypothetical protein